MSDGSKDEVYFMDCLISKGRSLLRVKRWRKIEVEKGSEEREKEEHQIASFSYFYNFELSSAEWVSDNIAIRN